jgi:plastocyanin
MSFRSRAAAIAATAAVVLAVPVAAQATTKVVTMGPPAKAGKSFQRQVSDVNDFFPHGVTIRVGDSVKFVNTGFHSVDFPAHAAAPLPLISPTGQKVAGANDAAGSPFWFNGQDQLGFSPSLVVKSGFGKRFTYNGSARVESGLPIQQHIKPMTVKFTKAGSFTYYCNVHAGMKGVVRVVAKSRPIPSAKADAKTLKTQISRDLEIAKRLAATKPPAGVVDVGSAGPHGVEYFGFFPKSVSVPVGTTLRFRMTKGSFEDHTATTGPGTDVEKEPNSYLGKLAASFNSPAVDPAAAYPSDVPGGAPAVLTPTLHGNGFWNAGVMDTSNATPLPSENAVKFGAPGTYQFVCLIHPFMHGTIIVK